MRFLVTNRALGPQVLFLGAALALSGCDKPLDLDFRGAIGGGLNTADAARAATAKRPAPDDRGVISYPNYQVAVARRGDTLSSVAARVGLDAKALASYNGVAPADPLREGEIVALPRRVAEPSPATGSPTTGPIQPPDVDITTLAGTAIDRAGSQRVETTSLAPATQASKPAAAAKEPKIARGLEPQRHKVQRGETAYTVARLYNVSVRSLAEWNGLGPDFAIREGQFLLIPVAEATAPKTAAKKSEPETVAPGTGSPTPVPPSATKPLPAEKTAPLATQKAEDSKPAANLGKTQTKASTGSGRLAYPVTGKIIRDYSKGKNEGIDIAASSGTAIGAADAGTVAYITKTTEDVQIIVVKHASDLTTVYANVDNIAVKKGDTVKRGQKIAQIPGGKSAYVHFEVRKGFDSTDPMGYLQ
ncbi:LysM peptidoglycan-binding domain-containing M23 family metallopeptidase [Rhodalgimonas zhirmunskyi]|uniref:LysM peptidoglycan-binding domain-containing M23 family metallopeptidase n=1 Tax=Rhodalgimonas zhirmunskyi TaxID=2964767 RepID=A0AAJ1X4K4_9RHOB|nr:LysM peptidoglycan-binding domain-containing M23 family metallopeptidase [Rhodoalgimonas zhirmunskyi]MDQ2092604.1 LysM peptidoglycan-binding domain-containing M23 family metallopeptidase [Rhodoalgimonas zhirmunskyi]